jgi:predicted CopG family antitoxin
MMYGYNVGMIVKDFYIRNDQYRDLKKLKGTMSEHVRNAIDEYLKRLKKDKLNVSYSKS